MKIIILINIDNNINNETITLLIDIWKKYMYSHLNIDVFFIQQIDNTECNDDYIDHINNNIFLKTNYDSKILEKIIKSINCLINNNVKFDYIIKANICSFLIFDKLYNFLINNKHLNYTGENIKGIPVKTKYKKYFENIEQKNRLYFYGNIHIFSKLAIVDLINNTNNLDINFDDDIMIGLILSSKYKLFKITDDKHFNNKNNTNEFIYTYNLKSNENFDDLIKFYTNLFNKYYNDDILNKNIYYFIKKNCNSHNSIENIDNLNLSNFMIEVKIKDISNDCDYTISKTNINYNDISHIHDLSCVNNIIETINLYKIKNDNLLFNSIYESICVHNEKINNILTNELNDEYLKYINGSISKFIDSYSIYKKILFICDENDIKNFYFIEELKKIFNHVNCDINILYFNNDIELEKKIYTLYFKPNLIIKFNKTNINLKEKFECNIIYILSSDINVNIDEIKKSDVYFTNNLNIKKTFYQKHNINIQFLCLNYLPFYGIINQKKINNDNKIYNFGLIIANDNYKNLTNVIEFLRNKKNVIIFSNDCSKYSNYNFTLINTCDYEKIKQYTNDIKCIIKNDHDINIFEIESYINGSIILRNFTNINYNNLQEKIQIKKNTNYLLGNFSYLYSNYNLCELFKSNSVEFYFIDNDKTKDFILFVNLDIDVELNICELIKLVKINTLTIGYNNLIYTETELMGLYYLYGLGNIDKNNIGIEMFYEDYIINLDDDKYTRKYNKDLFILISGYYYGFNNYNINKLPDKFNKNIFHDSKVLLASKMIKGYGGVQNTSRQLLKILDYKYNVCILSNNLKDNEFNFVNDFIDQDIHHILIVKLKKNVDIINYINNTNFIFIVNNKLEELMNLNINKQMNMICHNSMDPLNLNILNNKYKIDKLFTINNFHKNLMIYNGFDGEIYLYNNYVFESKNDLLMVDKKIKTEFTYNIGFIGRLSKEKNIQLLIDGINYFNLNNNLNIKLNLYIIGSGNQNLVNLNTNIKLLGFLNKNEIKKYYNIFDYVISSSLTEGKSFSIIESLNYGIPCIHSNINGINEIIYDNINGFLFELENYTNYKYNMNFDILNDIKNTNIKNTNINIENISNVLTKAYLIDINEWNQMSNNSVKLINNEYSKDLCMKNNLNNFGINIMNKYCSKYKIFVNFKPDVNKAYGGGNISIYYIIKYLTSTYSNFNITYELDNNINLYIIVDPFSDGKFKKYSLDDVIKHRNEYNKEGKIIIRINDCDKTRIITNPIRSREYQIIKNTSNIDYFIFNSNFIKSYYFEKFKEFCINIKKIEYSVILNGCEPNIFINEDKFISNNKKTKIVTHHWSNNINKGYQTYYDLWRHSQINKNCGFEFIFIGQNVPDMFKEVPIIGPFVKNELATELNKCQIYITDSKYDSCPNHVLEALSCGLPILYSNCEGGAREICTISKYEVGEIYNNFDELIEKVNKIKNNYNYYRENIKKSKHIYTSQNCVNKYHITILKNIFNMNQKIIPKFKNNIINIYSSNNDSYLLMDELNFQLIKGNNLFSINIDTYENIQLLTNCNDDITININEFTNNNNKLDNDKVNVLFCSDENYFVGLFAGLHSVITNTNYLTQTHFNFMIPIDDSNLFSKLLIEFELKMNIELNKSIIYLDPNIIDKTLYESKCYNGGGHLLNIGNFSRLLIGEFMNYSKLIYLDSDSIVQTDIIKKIINFKLDYPIYSAYANLINVNNKKQIVIKMNSILNSEYDWVKLIGKKIDPNEYVYMGAPFLTNCCKWTNIYNETINIIRTHNNADKGIYKLFTMSIQNILFYNKTGNISHVLNVLQDLGSSRKEWDTIDLIDKDILDWSGILKPWYSNGRYKHLWQLHDIMNLSCKYGEINVEKNIIETFTNNKITNNNENFDFNLNIVSNKYLDIEKEIFNKFQNYLMKIIETNKKNSKYNVLYVCDAKYLLEKMSRVRFWAIEELGKYNDLNIYLTGPGFTNFILNKTLQENIINMGINMGINFDLVIWYKPLDIGYNFDLTHKLPFKTCLRYNEMWDEKWTCKEINETMTDIIICHHYNDYLLYSEKLYKDNKNVKFIYNPHHANPNIFKPLNIQKDIDILISGVTKKTHYPFKYRLFNLINKYKDTKLSKYNIYIHKHPGYNNELNFENQNQIEYNQIINRSKLCICCTSRYNYRLAKYVEIPMSGSVIIGDLPYEDERFSNFVVKINNEMSDEEIINIIINTLENQRELDKKIKIGIDWSKNYTTKKYTDILVDIIKNKINQKIFIISDEIKENHPEFGGQKWICDILKQEFIEKFPLDTTTNANEASIIWYLAPWNYRYIPNGFKTDTWFEFLKTKKVIFTQHHIDEEKYAIGALDKQFEFMKTYGTKFHSICNLTKTAMSKYFLDSMISVQKLWVNKDVFFYIKDKHKLRTKYNFDQDAFLIGSFQKDTEGKTNLPKLSKGPDIFVKIVKDMYKTNNKIEVILTGLRREYIINELKNSGIKYHYFNMVCLNEINELFNCLDLYIVSSRCEGGPRAVFEAGLTKTPIISTRVGISPELMSRSALFNADNWISYKGAKSNVELLYNNVLKLTTDDYMEEFKNYLLK